MENKIRSINNSIVEYYETPLEFIKQLTRKSYVYKCPKNDKNYFLKISPYNGLEKFQFLESQSVDNVLYPELNKNNEYLTRGRSDAFYVTEYFKNNDILLEVKAKNMLNSLKYLHNKTNFQRQLSVRLARPKFEEITKQLDYKFRAIENYVRSVESDNLNIFSMPILANYQYILDAKKELIMLQKRIISYIKAREKVDYVFVHNRPSLDHLLNVRGMNYLISIENGKIGINSLDLAKFYINNENLNIDFSELIVNDYFDSTNSFNYDYFRFLVLYIYVKKIILSSERYLTAQSFINISDSIKKYFNNFLDNKKNVSNEYETNN